MDADTDLEVDPSIAAAMGFGGFGSQTKGKRKFDSNDGFVDTSAGQLSATGANNLPVREHKTARVAQDSAAGASDNAAATDPTQRDSSPLPYDPKTQDSPSLESLRHGVRNTRGDMVYFLPSFLEDPWAGLKAR